MSAQVNDREGIDATRNGFASVGTNANSTEPNVRLAPASESEPPTVGMQFYSFATAKDARESVKVDARSTVLDDRP